MRKPYLLNYLHLETSRNSSVTSSQWGRSFIVQKLATPWPRPNKGDVSVHILPKLLDRENSSTFLCDRLQVMFISPGGITNSTDHWRSVKIAELVILFIGCVTVFPDFSWNSHCTVLKITVFIPSLHAISSDIVFLPFLWFILLYFTAS